MKVPSSVTAPPENPRLLEAIVVGSGFGGAVAACRLSQAGFTVTVLERGRRYAPGDYPSLPSESALLPDTRRWSWNTDQGLWDVLDLGDVISVQAAGYGGGSLIYANVHLRPPDEVFDDKWPEAYASGTILRDYYDLVAAMLDVSPLTSDTAHYPSPPKSDGMERAAAGLGRKDECFRPPLAVNYTNLPGDLNAFGMTQRACTGCGACCTGCPVGAKNTLDRNYLAIAESNGVRVRTQSEVTDIAQLPNGDWQVTYTDHLEAREKQLVAPYLFLCAGSVRSTELLARADPNKCPVKRRNVGIGYFPGGDSIGVVYDTAAPQQPSAGPTITTATVHWNRALGPISYFMVQDGGYAPELERLLGFMRGSLWVGRNRLTHSTRAATAHAEPVVNERVSSRLQSALDDMIDAVKANGFSMAVSPHQRRMLQQFFGELSQLLALPSLIRGTIQRNIASRHAGHWLLGSLNRESWTARTLRKLDADWMRGWYGGDELMAENVLASLQALGDQGLSDLLRRVLGFSTQDASHRLMLLGMGRDSTGGVLEYDAENRTMVADLDLHKLAAGYASQERLMADIANKLGGELRVNPMWSFLGRPVTVHNQGGCPMSDDPERGVTTPYGRVHGCQRLYVLDGSILCQSVGVNPSATIAAIAERNIFEFICEVKGRDWIGQPTPGAQQYRRHLALRDQWKAKAKGWQLTPPRPNRAPTPFQSQPLGIEFHESMEGYYSPTDQSPDRFPSDAHRDAEYRRLEGVGTPQYPLRVELRVSHANLSEFLEDESHRLALEGRLSLMLPGERHRTEHRVTGFLNLLVEKLDDKLDDEQQARRDAHQYFTTEQAQLRKQRSRSSYLTQNDCPDPERGRPLPAGTRFMRYLLESSDGTFALDGYKRISNKPGLGAYRDVTCLFVKVHRAGNLFGAGAIHIDVSELLEKQLPSVRATGTTDQARQAWATQAFVSYFFGSLQRIYVPAASSMFERVVRGKRLGVIGARP